MEVSTKQEIARKVVSRTLRQAGRGDLLELFEKVVPDGIAESMLYFILFMRYRARAFRTPENLENKIITTLERDITGLNFYRGHKRRNWFLPKVGPYVAILSEKDFLEIYLQSIMEEMEEACKEEQWWKCLPLYQELEAAGTDINRTSPRLLSRYSQVKQYLNPFLFN